MLIVAAVVGVMLGFTAGCAVGYAVGLERRLPKACEIPNCGKPALDGELVCAWHARTHVPHLLRHLTRRDHRRGRA